MQSSPLQGRYTPMLAAALLALIPYILITSAAPFYREQVMRDLGTKPNALSVVSGLSVAGYAFGALFSGDLINRFKQRNLFIVLRSPDHDIEQFNPMITVDGVKFEKQ